MDIFVSVGNGTESFHRMLDIIRKISNHLPYRIIVQHGRTIFDSKTCCIFPFTDEDEFKKLISKSQFFITHGGVGSIITSINLGKKPIVIPRRKKFNEIIDDHQLAFTNELSKQGLIDAITSEDSLNIEKTLLKIINTKKNRSILTNKKNNYINIVQSRIRKTLENPETKLCLVSAAGGHLTELKKFSDIYASHEYFHVINIPIVTTKKMQDRIITITLCQRDWKGIINFYEAWNILRIEKPNIIMTTGAWPAIPFGIIGRLLGVRVVYIETMAKVIRPTATGKIMKYIANDLFYPWESLKEFFPKGIYCGPLI